MSTVERFGDYVIKLGTEGYRAWSQNDLFCLKFQHYGVRSSFLVDMTTGETEKIMLVPTLFACAVSNDGKLVSFADKDGNIWLLDRASNKIIKLVNCFSKYSLSKDSIIEYLFFLEGHNKIASFINCPCFYEDKDKDFFCIVVIDVENGNTVFSKIENSALLKVERNSDNFVIRFMLRNPFGKSAFELESFILTKYPFEKTNVFASDDFVKFGWDFVPRLYYQGEKHFDFQNELFVANIANKDIPYIIDGELSLFDVEQKKTVPSVNAFWHGKKFESFSWLPKKNWFLCKFKNEENFYVCDSVSGDKKAKIFFENHDLIIEFINSSGKTVLKPFATSKDFGFNKNSLPIKYIYLSSNGRYLIFNNTKKEFAEKIDFLLSFFK